MIFVLGDDAAGVIKRGRPSGSIDWAGLTLTKDAVRYSRPYLSYYKTCMSYYCFKQPSSIRREFGEAWVLLHVTFSIAFYGAHVIICPSGLLVVGTRSSGRVVFSCPSTPGMKPQ